METEQCVTKVERNGVFETTLVKVSFTDGRKRAFNVNEENPTVKAVSNAISLKEELPSNCKRMFAPFLVCDFLELRLRPNQDLNQAIKSWPKWLEKYGHETDAAFKIVYKRDALALTEHEKFVSNDLAIKLLFHEAANRVLKGVYPTTFSDAAFLAGLFLQATQGNHMDTRHYQGYITSCIENFVSNFHQKNFKPEEIEARIFSEHIKLKGTSAKKAMLAYLSKVRKYPVYGSIFYPACKNPPPGGLFSKRTENFVIGVNMKGIHVIDIEKNKSILSEPYSDIAWESADDSIVFEYGPTEMPNEMSFITPCAPLIDMLASKAITRLQQ